MLKPGISLEGASTSTTRANPLESLGSAEMGAGASSGSMISADQTKKQKKLMMTKTRDEMPISPQFDPT
jgi:hypothetical protein